MCSIFPNSCRLFFLATNCSQVLHNHMFKEQWPRFVEFLNIKVRLNISQKFVTLKSNLKNVKWGKGDISVWKTDTNLDWKVEIRSEIKSFLFFSSDFFIFFTLEISIPMDNSYIDTVNNNPLFSHHNPMNTDWFLSGSPISDYFSQPTILSGYRLIYSSINKSLEYTLDMQWRL